MDPTSNSAPFSISMFIRRLHGGGAERVFMRLAGEFQRRGHDVTVIAVQAPPHLRDWVPQGVRVIDLRARSIGTSLIPLSRHLRRHQPDVLLSAVSAINVIAITARLIARTSTAVVVTEHNTQSRQRSTATTFRRRRIIPALMRRTYPRADAIVAVSQGVCDDLEPYLGLPPGCVHAIVNPVVDDSLIHAAQEGIPARWAVRIGNAPLVVSAGRLTHHKDHETLLRAFARVVEEIPDARLAILGEGEARSDIERIRDELELGDAVLLAGFQPDVYGWFGSARVVALSSHYEGLPTILIEALAAGARVVSTDCPSGPAEILDYGRLGALVPIGDVDAFAEALIDALKAGRSEPPHPDDLARYRPESVIDQYVDLIDSILVGRAPPN